MQRKIFVFAIWHRPYSWFFKVDIIQTDIIEAFNSTLRYLDDLLNIDNFLL